MSGAFLPYLSYSGRMIDFDILLSSATLSAKVSIPIAPPDIISLTFSGIYFDMSTSIKLLEPIIATLMVTTSLKI